MTTLEADNRLITTAAKYSYLTSNKASGVSSLTLINTTDGFSINVGEVTMDLSTPAATTVTLASHGLVANDKIFFATTGALYSGITEYQVYYVSATNLSTNTFEFSATVGGSGVITTGTESGTHTLYRVNSIYALLGNIGSESAEIVKINTIDISTHTLTLDSVTKYGHAESTKVTLIPYNQVGFFWTATNTFATTTPLPNPNLITYIDLQVSDWFTTLDDGVHSSGYGWYVFYNATTGIYSDESNPLAYDGVDTDTVEDVLNDFFSLLNNKELKLVTRRDALSWMNEGISVIRNKLNMTNTEYSASDIATLTTVAGTVEYELPSNFSRMVSITGDASNSSDLTLAGNFSKYPVEYISLREAYSYSGSDTRYYIRGKYIGILPQPASVVNFYYNYLTRSSRVNSNSDTIDLPDNGVYSVKDWMMYRAYMKFNNPNAAAYYKMFQDNMNQMIIASMDRDANLDTMGIDWSANV